MELECSAVLGREHTEPNVRARAARRPAAAQRLPLRSQRDPNRGDLLALLPCHPNAADICVTQPLAASAVKAAARDTGATAKAKDSLQQDEYSRTGTDACRLAR